ncbi:MAG: helix-turn-helix domain-containing protein [Deltaproteobacteria bacterium]|nr:helix-turn-helix domain-containing protein [Deltaproteobacteria bacterium]
MADFRDRVPNIAKLTVAVGKDYSHVHAVLRGAVQCGPHLAIAIEKATGGQITRSDLRPDLWPVQGSASPTMSEAV